MHTSGAFELAPLNPPPCPMAPLQAACLARCNGARVELYPFGSVGLEEFRAMVAEACHSAEEHIIVSYSRKEFLQTGGWAGLCVEWCAADVGPWAGAAAMTCQCVLVWLDALKPARWLAPFVPLPAPA